MIMNSKYAIATMLCIACMAVDDKPHDLAENNVMNLFDTEHLAKILRELE